MTELIRAMHLQLHKMQKEFHKETGRPLQQIVVVVPEPLWIYVLQAANTLWGVKIDNQTLQLPDQLIVDGCYIFHKGTK